MNNLDKFINLLEQEVANHSIYVWGAQGQTHSSITKSWIKIRETSKENANRAIAYWNAQCAAGYQLKLKAFDCSGLGVWALQQLKLLSSSSDMSAATMYGKCTKIKKTDLRRGDWVFCHNGIKIVHVGYVVDDELNTIEAYGRDIGVTKRELSQGEWNRYGRPQFFKEEIMNDIVIVPRVDTPSTATTIVDTANKDVPKITVLSRSVNVRSQPNTNASVIGIARKGEVYNAVDNGWHYIDFNGKLGWISGKTTITRRN